MGRNGLFFILLCMVGMSWEGYAEMREFTTKDGETIYGEVIDYDLATDKVKIKTDRGRIIQNRASEYLGEDTVYIQDWDAVRRFPDNNYFRIYLSEPMSKNRWTKYVWRRNPGKQEPSLTWITDFERFGYEIKYDNQTGYDLENVEFKYCIFYRQEQFDWRAEEKAVDTVVRPCVKRFNIVPDGTSQKMDLNTVVLRNKERVVGSTTLTHWEGEGRFFKADLLGMVFRASITTLSGQTAVREIRVPDDLSEEYAWVEPTEENTSWPDDDLIERNDTEKPLTPWEEAGGGSGEGEEGS
jgi:hypothetical protein